MSNAILSLMLTVAVSAPNAGSLVHLASQGGHEAAAGVFDAPQVPAPEARCEAEADRERQVCVEEGRQNCDELRERSLAACLAPGTAPGSDQDAERSSSGGALRWVAFAGVGLAAFLVGALAGAAGAEICTCALSPTS